MTTASVLTASAFRAAAARSARDLPVLTDDQIRRAAPSVFAEEAHESRGARYGFIPTAQVLQGLRNEGFQVVKAAQTRCRDEGKAAFTKHLLRLRHPDASNLVAVGDEIPEIVLVNSHDGTSSYQLSAGWFRLVCLNGLVVASSQIDDVKVRHSGNVVDNVIEGSCRVIENLKQIAPVVDSYRGIQLDRHEQHALARAAIELRWGSDPETGNSLAPVSTDQLIRPRREADRNADLWTTFNVVQENLLKGGISGRNAFGRRTSTRAVAGVDANVRLNKALWTLTEVLASHKQAA